MKKLMRELLIPLGLLLMLSVFSWFWWAYDISSSIGAQAVDKALLWAIVVSLVLILTPDVYTWWTGHRR